MQRITRDRVAVAVLSSVLSACSSSDGGPVETTGSIRVSITPAALSLEQGTGGSLTVALTRTAGFNGAVRLSVTGLPTGITASITPTELTSTETSAAISVIVAAAVPAQTYTATITATATGVAAVSMTLPVTVRATPSSGPINVAYPICDAESAPVFFAYQDGNNAWQAVTPAPAGGGTSFLFTLTQPRGGVVAIYRSSALVTRTARAAARAPTRQRQLSRVLGAGQTVAQDAWVTDVRYASASELARDGAEYCGGRGSKTVTAVVNGVGAGQYGVLSLGPSNEVFVGGASKNPVTFSDVPIGALDFVAARLTAPGQPPDRVVVLRNLDIPDGGTLPATVDFNGQASSSPSSANVTVFGGSNDDLEIFSEVVTARGGRSLLWFDLSPSVTVNRRWAGLAPTTMIPGDFHSVVVFATPATEGDYRVALRYVGQVSDQALTLGLKIDAPSMQVAESGTYPRLRFFGDLPIDYNKGVEISVGDGEAGNTFTIAASGAYLAAEGSAHHYDLVMPDVRKLESFPAASRLVVGPNDVSFSAFGFTGPGVFDLIATVGSEYKAATIGSTFVVP